MPDVGSNTKDVLLNGPVYAVVAIVIIIGLAIIFLYFKADKKADSSHIRNLVDVNTKQMEILIDTIKGNTERDMERIHGAVQRLTETLANFTVQIERERSDRETMYQMNMQLRESLTIQGKRLGDIEQKVALIEERTRG